MNVLTPLIAHLAVVAQLHASPMQRAARTRAPATVPDSAAALRTARKAQAAFELFRRMRLPHGERLTGECDIIIGRYCYSRGDDDDSDDDTAPEEPASIRKRREALLALLDSLTRLLPGDGWLAGQRVRYLVDAGRPDEAARFASTACLAERSWCAALAGYAWHRAGDFAHSDSSFTVALAAMPDEERCTWLDIEPLLEDDLASRFRHLDCPAREWLAVRLLRLGAPLYSVGGADLLTEHLSRVTRSRISDHTSLVDGPSWGDDSREVVLRYGWPKWYTRAEAPPGSMLQASITGHDAGRPFYFLPDARVVDHPGRSDDDDWRLNERRAPAAYSPTYARSMHALPSQIARFRHGDTAIVVGAWDVGADTTLAHRALRAGLVLTANGRDGAASMLDSAGDRGVLVTRSVLDSGLISLELLAREQRRAARTRLGLPAPVRAGLALSDLLLYAAPADSSSQSGASIEDVAATALASGFIRNRRLGVYWEAYGTRTGAPVHYSISVEPTDVPWYRRAAERVGIADPQSALSVRWTDVARAASVAQRLMQVDLARLRPGEYELTVSVASGGSVARSTRKIELR